ncbi:hypothetical protein Zmor_003599 [Zophobas morio]|uniref:Uncharacterized protein n=1 Tax=Zophobas morio TaxID=2755281 RepID=A0AA38HM79_9CUCU|nr:hypothetical protein Zmor_003599 [Zophobas morio]
MDLGPRFAPKVDKTEDLKSWKSLQPRDQSGPSRGAHECIVSPWRLLRILSYWKRRKLESLTHSPRWRASSLPEAWRSILERVQASVSEGTLLYSLLLNTNLLLLRAVQSTQQKYLKYQVQSTS